MESFHFLLPVLVLLAAVWLLRRGAGARTSRPRDAATEVQRDLIAAEQSGAGRVREMELRLYDYGREVEGRIETSLALLDELVRQADDEIVRLQSLLDESRREPAAAVLPADVGALSPEQRRMICFLAMAGYRAEEIARLVNRPVEQIRQSLADDSRGANAA